MSWIPIGIAACARDSPPEPSGTETTISADPTTTWVAPVPGTVTEVERVLPPASAPGATWTELFTVPYGAAAVPVGRERWIVIDDEVHAVSFDEREGGWTADAAPLPPGVASGAVGVPLVAGGYVLPVASGGLLLEDQLGDPEVVDAGVADATWVYSDGRSLFSTDGRALDRAWNNETSVRRAETFRTPSDDRFRVDVDGSTLLVDLFDVDRRVRVEVGALSDIEFDADLSGTVHVVLRDGDRAGYLSVAHDGAVSDVEPVPAATHVRVVPDTTTVALSAATADGLRVWTRVAPDIVGIVSADLPEDTCQWVRDYAADAGEPVPPMQLEQGAVPGFPAGITGARLSAADGVVRPDLDGDGARDAAFVVWCSVGVSDHNAEIHAIDAAGGSLGWFEVGEDAAERRLWSLAADGDDLVVEYQGWDVDERGCCATVQVTDRYRWSDGGFRRVDRRTWTAADGAQEILAAFNDDDGGDAIERADPDAFVALQQLRDEHGELSGCTTTANAPGDALERTCVVRAADRPDDEHRMTLTWIDVDEWRATALEPIA